MHSAIIHRDTWKPYDREPVTFDGVACCVSVELFGDGEISVELIPEDENEGERWPVDVLKLPKDQQRDLLRQLRDD